MSRFEKIVVFAALFGQATVLALGFSGLNSAAPYLSAGWFSLLCAGTFLLSVLTLVFVLRDLYRRPFKNPNAKLTWLLIILLTGGIGLVIYFFRHALHERVQADAA